MEKWEEDQWIKIKISEMSPHMHNQLLFNKRTENNPR